MKARRRCSSMPGRYLPAPFFFCLSAIIGLLLVNTANGAWQPPIGIPAPSFGIDTPTYDAATHCPNWPTKQNARARGDAYDCFYVDNSAACNDSNAGSHGTPEAPRCTVPQGSFSAGTYVDVRGGRSIPYTSTWSNRFHISGIGTAAEYIVISGKKATTGKPILNKYVHIGGEDGSTKYLIFEDFETRAGLDIRPAKNGYDQTHVSVRNNTMHGAGMFRSGEEFAVGLDNPRSFPGIVISDIVFYQNESYDAGQWNSPTEDDTCAFYVRGGVSRIWVVDNVAYRSGGDGIAGGHSANRTSHHYYIGRNTLYQHRENCIDVKEIDDVIISENTCHTLRTPADGSANGEGIVIHYGANSVGPNKAWVLFNTINDVVNGIQINSTKGDGYVIGNLIYGIRHDNSPWTPTSPYSNGAGIRSYSIETSYIVDNIIYGYETGIQLPNPATGRTYVVHGNILSNRAAAGGYEIFVPGGCENVSLDHNQFYSPAGNISFGWGGAQQVGLSRITCRHCAEEAPHFLAPTSDFRLMSSSPADAVSGQHGIYTTFHNTYGLPIRKEGTDPNGSKK